MKRTKPILSHLVVFCLGGCLVNAVFGCLLYAETADPSEVFIDFEHLPDGTATGLGPIEEVDRIQVGDFFQIVVTVTNLGSTTETVANFYDWDLSGTGDAAVLGGQPCVCLAWEELQSGDSAILIPFCGCHAFEATKAGTVTMHISVEPDCHGTFTFQIGP